MENLKALLQTKRDRQQDLENHKLPAGPDLASEVAFDIEYRRLFLASLEADKAYAVAIEAAAQDGVTIAPGN